MIRLIASAGVRVERREGQVTRFSDRQSRGDRFQVAHFADQDYVRIFAQSVLERVRKRLGIASDLALIDDAFLMLVDELDRIFYRDDMAFSLAVDLVDHRGESGRFSGAGWPGDENQSAGLLRHLGDRTRKSELIEGFDRERNLPDDHRHAAALLEHVAAEASETLNSEREIELVFQLEALLLHFGEHRIRQLQRVLRGQLTFRGRVCYVTIDAQLGALTGHDMQVGRIAGDHLFQKGAEVDSTWPCRSGWRRRVNER